MFWITVFSICVRGISFVVDVITFIPFYIIDNPSKKLKLSRRLKAKPVIDGDSSSPYRSLDLHNGLTVTPVDDCYTIDGLFEHAVSSYSDLPSLGTRELLHEEEEIQSNGKIFKKALYGNYTWLTFAEVKDKVVKIGRGLLEIDSSSPTVCIYAETCAKWIITAFACFKLNAPIITLYATLGEEAIKYGLAETDVNIIVTSAENLNKLKKIIDHLKQLKCIVYFEGAKQPDVDDFKDARIKVLSFSELENIGTKALNIFGPITQKPSPNDLAVIMYTSGSTGQPKGVMMSHKNICASLSGIMQFCTGVSSSDTYVAYLPLAHIFELAAEIGCFSHGAKIGFSSPNTLADQSTKIKRGSKGDVSILRPTLMALVPVIMDRMYKSVWDKVNKSGEWKKAVFKFAYDYKKKWYLAGYSTPLMDRFVFKSLKKMMGGNLRMMVAGGAPLSTDTHIFMNICFCCPISQGYGLTETCGGGTIQLPDDLSTGRVGVPITCCEVKLVNWDEGGYRATDQPCPRGEVWISGDNVTIGYYKNPEKTKEDYKMIDGQRWFATGDIGIWEPDGCLRIIDRKKDLVKLQAGEYISFGKVETALCLSPYIDNICMWADSSKDYAIAFILPNRKHVVQLAEMLEIKESDCNKLFDDKKLNIAVLKHLQEFGLKAKLEKFEVPVKVLLVKEQWSPDSGFLTDSFKLKRKFIEKFYAKEISQMYAD